MLDVLLKCACQAIGIVNLAFDFGIELEASVGTDAGAALAITHRQGLGTLRHIDVHWLWIQERIKYGDLSTHNVHGNEDPADLLTKHFNQEEILKHLSTLGFRVAEGRADKSLSMNNIARSEARTQALTRKQKELWRKYRIERNYGNETIAQVLTREWQQILKDNPQIKNIAEDVDHWVADEQCVTRVHKQPRRNLCTPFQCRGAPELSTLTSTRITHGVFEDGTTFLKQGHWTCKLSRDIDIGRPWTGRTVFIPKVNSPQGAECNASNKERFIGSLRLMRNNPEDSTNQFQLFTLLFGLYGTSASVHVLPQVQARGASPLVCLSVSSFNK